ncbi:MAG: translation initiation factor eIF-1A [Candidatus Micrarchaeota archaeon]|nr:translation initiation factor eIF-1A [Candidatus Micrarchaeota archaeon]MCX8154496.1 translation initiation factor eIF-1A [Candidatus Micrarchaeota archaeon]
MKEEFDAKRIKMPEGNEMFAVVISEVGGARMLCYCIDGKERICRVPGRMKSKFWIKEGDLVLVKPWDVQGDERGDIVWQYRAIEVQYLKDRGLLNGLPI